MASIANTFQFQLDKYLEDYDQSEDADPVISRAEKAIDYFSKETVEKLIKPTHLHIGEYALKKGQRPISKL